MSATPLDHTAPRNGAVDKLIKVGGAEHTRRHMAFGGKPIGETHGGSLQVLQLQRVGEKLIRDRGDGVVGKISARPHHTGSSQVKRRH